MLGIKSVCSNFYKKKSSSRNIIYLSSVKRRFFFPLTASITAQDIGESKLLNGFNMKAEPQRVSLL